MKWLLLLSLLTTQGMATEVAGKIFYATPNDELAVREVTLEVPSRRQGEVVLRGENIEWRTNKFRSFNKNGRKVLTADFEVERNGKKKILSFTGTYIRTSDQILYYGDFYRLKKPDGPKPPNRRPPQRLNHGNGNGYGHGHGHQKHLGGFYFSHTR